MYCVVSSFSFEGIFFRRGATDLAERLADVALCLWSSMDSFGPVHSRLPNLTRYLFPAHTAVFFSVTYDL
jgi:hypothetical protein